MPTPNIVAKNGGRRFYSLSLSKLCSALGEGGFSVLALLFPGTFCNQVQVSSALKSRAMVMTPSLRTTRLEPCPPLLCLSPLTTWLYFCGFVCSQFHHPFFLPSRGCKHCGSNLSCREAGVASCLPSCLVEICRPLVLGSSLLCSAQPFQGLILAVLLQDSLLLVSPPCRRVSDKEERARVASVSRSG